MQGLTGGTKQLSNVTPEAGAVLNQLLQALTQGGVGQQITPSTTVDKASIQPYLDLFTQQNARNLAQAKESAGNLTGSGLSTAIGAEAGRASTEQNAFLANLFETRRQNDANRYAQTLLGALNGNAAGVQNVYQPGFLDYASQGAMAAASGGAFGAGGIFGKSTKAGG